ncbi:hypothetical protein OG920_30655 [Streptomyces europaeiscabiei]|uniref:hypothetical protein n=1 Tax=Streptomyces europaeiscabiei TaxID=146819 RepID=UPI0029AC6BF9|nr:hypothetical protein [Streptomyces europaeiscabiei]MDX3581949.1 hypothetical protein [Streptomyces europaeiscabiei]MDX3619087.1 hypothetical protein [Streptomyces europaeiscabiei]
MTIPGFHAEAAVRPISGRYTTGRPTRSLRRAAAERIVPSFTEEERQQLIFCNQRVDNCLGDCEPLADNFYEWQRCSQTCWEYYDQCVADPPLEW